MKYLRGQRRGSWALVIVLVLGIQLVSGATQANSNSKQSKSSLKKLESSHLTQIKPESRSSKLTTDNQAAAVADKKQGDSLDAQESSGVSSVINPQTGASSNSGGASPDVGAAASSSSSSSSSSSESSSSSAEEYVQIKPEEVNVNDQGKEIEPTLNISGGQSASEGVEHKSAADDELNAHLAQDIINQQESAQKPYSAPAPRSSGGSQKPKYKPQPGYGSARLNAYGPGAARGPTLRHPRGFPGSNRVPPHYHALKGKLTGFNSIVSQYPHPAPGYPHHGPRHLPRGAAAGYAAFRDFVRAHANKYKHSGPQAMSYGKPEGFKDHTSYGQEYSGAPSGPSAGYSQQGDRTKVTVAQAFIPHLALAGQQQGYGSQPQQQQHQQQYVSTYSNPMLSKLYGGHAPQGVGRPEYNKDYGMVIHYPQATVYTEPMTVDQLYKLTGGGISQVIEQLQYNLAHGYRDEANMIRPNNKHQIGHGISIHAKEYHAPGKSGQYVPTTAAVITTSSVPKGSYGSGEPSAPNGNSYEQTGSLDLGSGYDRVRQAVAQSQKSQYNTKPVEQPTSGQPNYGQLANGGSYESSSAKHSGEPLSAISGLIGSELESLYKANQALTKQIEPEIHSQIQSFMKNSQHAGRPLRYADLDQRSPFVLQAQQHHNGASYSAANTGNKYAVPQSGHRQTRHRGQRKGQHPRSNRYANRHPHLANQHWLPQGHGRPQSHHLGHQQQMQQYGRHPGKAHQAQQHAQQVYNYQAAEQALNQQMSQLLQDFNHGEEQYNGKSQPTHATSQGYPQKVLQKYQKQQSQANYQNPGQMLHEGLEIPQGPNDQVGEIADLLEALKGSLEMSGRLESQAGYGDKNQAGELTRDVRYLASALGQTPSYAMQVPVSAAPAHEAQADHKQQTGLYQQQQQQQQQQQPQPHPQVQSPAEAQPTSYQLVGKQQGFYQTAPQVEAGAYVSAGGQPQPAAEQQQQQAADYAQQQAQTQAIIGNPQSGIYGLQTSSPIAGSYAHQLTPDRQAAAQSPASYSNSEHSQLINHLVPVTEVAQPVASDYAASSGAHQAAATSEAHQPANQIAVAAPTASQYQSAQPLSSFVDSLPTDYQELLRQPALVSGHSSIPHLAALGQEIQNQSAPSGAYSNTTSAQASSSQASQSQVGDESSAQQDDLRKLYNQQASSSSSSSSSTSLTDTSGSESQQGQLQQSQYRKA